MKIQTLFIFLTGCIFSVCSCSDPADAKQDYTYIPLAKFKDDSAAIKNNTPVRLLALSGGKETDTSNTYYAQVIVLNPETNDTLCILTPFFKIPVPGYDSTYVSPMLYSFEKHISNAVYERVSGPAFDEILNISGSISRITEELPDSAVTEMMQTAKPKLVAINETLPIFRNRYKTVIGVLVFAVDPQ